MKIYGTASNDLWKEIGLDAYDKDNPPVISVVGAGGKTSLICELSQCLNQRKQPHIIATTTHMWPMDFGEYGRCIGNIGEEGKLKPPTDEAWHWIFSEKIPVLIEADGSKGLPLKAPEEWEPVIKDETTDVFAIVGASCLGKVLTDVCHRPDKVTKLLHCPKDHKMTEADIICLATHRYGLRKNVKSSWKYRIVINQVDDDTMYESIKNMKIKIREKGCVETFFTCMKR